MLSKCGTKAAVFHYVRDGLDLELVWGKNLASEPRVLECLRVCFGARWSWAVGDVLMISGNGTRYSRWD